MSNTKLIRTHIFRQKYSIHQGKTTDLFSSTMNNWMVIIFHNWILFDRTVFVWTCFWNNFHNDTVSPQIYYFPYFYTSWTLTGFRQNVTLFKKCYVRNRLLSFIRTNEFIYVEPLFTLFYDIKKCLIDIFMPVLNYIWEKYGISWLLLV